MFTKEELVKMPEFWMEEIQNELYVVLRDYMCENNLNQTQLAEKLGFTKGYISQVLHGNFNHSLQKLIELTIAIDKAPKIEFIDMDNYISKLYNDHEMKVVSMEAVSIDAEPNEISMYNSKMLA